MFLRILQGLCVCTVISYMFVEFLWTFTRRCACTNCIVCLHSIAVFIQNYSSRCHGLRLSVLNEATTYLLQNRKVKAKAS